MDPIHRVLETLLDAPKADREIVELAVSQHGSLLSCWSAMEKYMGFTALIRDTGWTHNPLLKPYFLVGDSFG